ncbi:hypothetical protein GCM10027589_52790 [Actinocorallia lasiicapitis]
MGFGVPCEKVLAEPPGLFAHEDAPPLHEIHRANIPRPADTLAKVREGLPKGVGCGFIW